MNAEIIFMVLDVTIVGLLIVAVRTLCNILSELRKGK